MTNQIGFSQNIQTNFSHQEDVIITHIDNYKLEEPCTACLVIDSRPNIMPIIKSDNFPMWIWYFPMPKTFVIKLKENIDVQVVLGPMKLPGEEDGKIGGSLCFFRSPIITMPAEKYINSIKFNTINFGRSQQNLHDLSNTTESGVTKFVYKNLQISLTQRFSIYDNDHNLIEIPDYAVTHIGEITNVNGQYFKVNEAEKILRILRMFLSFYQRSRCGITLVKAIEIEGKESLFEWGTNYIRPWKHRHELLLPTVEKGGEKISLLFAGFWDLSNCQKWEKVLSRVVDYYLNSEDGPFHVGIILIHSALEILCQKINVKKQDESMGKFLSRSIRKMEICTRIPSTCSSLDNLFSNCSKADSDGLKAISELRNDLIHSKQKYDDNAEAQMEALSLGQSYIELMILKLCNYRGQYHNRLAIAGESANQLVPWANEEIP